MTKKLYHSSFIAPALLATAMLQACVSGHTGAPVLSVKTPDKAKTQPSKASTKVISSASQPEGKQCTHIQRSTQIAELGRTTHIPKGSFRKHSNFMAQRLRNLPIVYESPWSHDHAHSTQATTRTLASKKSSNTTDCKSAMLNTKRPTSPNALAHVISAPMGAIGEHTPASFPVIRREPLPGLLADDEAHRRFEQASIKPCNSSQRPHSQDLPGYSGAEPPIEALLKRLQNFEGHSTEAYLDCIAAITRIVDGDNASRVCMVLDKAYDKLNSLFQGVKAPYGLEHVRKKLSNTRTDIEHFQRIAQDRKSKTTWHYLPPCLCCQDRVQIDYKRVSGIVRNYPKIATTLVPILLEKYRASLFYDEQLIININDAKALFIYDCLTTYPEHAPRLFSIIQEAMPTLTTETEVIERLPAFIAQAPKYALEGIHILNAALHNPRSRIRILALRASISLLHTCPDHGPYLNQDQLHKAFGRMRRALQGPESATKKIAQEVLVCIQKDSEGFLSRLWNRYTEQRQQKNF